MRSVVQPTVPQDQAIDDLFKSISEKVLASDFIGLVQQDLKSIEDNLKLTCNFLVKNDAKKIINENSILFFISLP